jgi:hypothetical protein
MPPDQSKPKQGLPGGTWFVTPTLSDELPAIDVHAQPNASDLVLHEDDWRQCEFVSTQHVEAINKELLAIRQIRMENSNPSGKGGWNKVHSRKLIKNPLLPPFNWSLLLRVVGVEASAVSRACVRDWLRPGISVFRDSFSFKVGKLPMYGLRDGEDVQVLSIDPSERAGLPKEQAELLAIHFIGHRAVSIHWPSAAYLNSVEGLAEFFQKTK